MYKCGWNGCEKAYGTLNHLNAHVTMQSHGQKRTPEGMRHPSSQNNSSRRAYVVVVDSSDAPHVFTLVLTPGALDNHLASGTMLARGDAMLVVLNR